MDMWGTAFVAWHSLDRNYSKRGRRTRVGILIWEDLKSVLSMGGLGQNKS
jgi:hypothetical protein